MAEPRVDVLLATFNGERYLDAQIQSLLAQKGVAVRILAGDDGSTDGTLALLHQYAQRHPMRVCLVPNPNPGRGGLRNFAHLMATSLRDRQAAWIAFSDQDDVWLTDKLALSVQQMQRLEQESGADLPCLVHTDLQVVDANLHPIHPSLAVLQGMQPAQATPLSQLSVNQVTGCSMLVNRRLLELALPIPAEAIVHDWWCALISGSGRRVFLPQAMLHYRQHDANQIGARNRSLKSRLRLLALDAQGVWRTVRRLGRQTSAQAQALVQRLEQNQLNARYVRDYLDWRANALPKRLLNYRRYYPGPELDRLSRCLLWENGIEND